MGAGRGDADVPRSVPGDLARGDYRIRRLPPQPGRDQAGVRRALPAARGGDRRVSLGHAAVRRDRGQKAASPEVMGRLEVIARARSSARGDPAGLLRGLRPLAMTLALAAPASAQTLRDYEYSLPIRGER